MLVLKIVFGIIVTLPILILAEVLFEKTVADAVVGTTAKKRIPFYKRILPKQKKNRRKRRRSESEPAESAVAEEAEEEGQQASE